MADIWLCIRCYNNLLVSQLQAAVVHPFVITVSIHAAIIYLTRTQPAAHDLSHIFGHLHIKGK